MKTFRQLTSAEKEKVAQARELYEKFLAEDDKSVVIIERIFGMGNAKALNSPEKRALWRVGHEMNWCGCFSYSKHSMDFWDFTAKDGQAVTENDPYHMTLGACTPRKGWEQ